MQSLRTVVRRTAVAVVAVGTLAGVTGGVAGAATPSGRAQAAVVKSFNCGNAQRLLGSTGRIEARYAKRLAGLARLEAKATQAKRPKLAAYWGRVETHVRNAENRQLHNRRYLARQARFARLARGKCHV
jgi:hypothetical protein